MLCHLYSIASFLMLCALGNPLVNSLTTIGSDIDLEADNRTLNHNQTIESTESDIKYEKFNASTGSANQTYDEELLSASSASQLTWVRSTDGKYVSVKPDPNTNSSHLLKNLLKVFDKNADKREDTDLGLPPDIAHEYIDAVNPPKFRIPVQYGTIHYLTSSISPPLAPYENRIHAGSSVIKTKANYTTHTTPQKQSPKHSGDQTPRNIDLDTLLKAELDAKRDELDQTNIYTPAPNLFALLPNKPNTENPFDESNYKTPNRVKTSTHRPYVTSADSVNHFHIDSSNVGPNVGQFVYSDGIPSVRVNIPSNKPTIAITTPNSISLITTSSATRVLVLKSTIPTTTTVRPIMYTKLKIKTMNTSSGNTTKSSPTSTKRTTRGPKTTTKTPTVLMSTTIAEKNTNKSTDWSSRVNNQSTDSSSESNDSINLINGLRESTGIESHEPYITDNAILRSNKNKKKTSEESYSSTESVTNKTDYSDFDYADNSALNPNYTIPDGFADYPGANYRLTTERLAYILIGSCCALSILCLIVVAMSVRCRDMCDEYRSWKKAEKAALRWQRHQYRLAHHQQDLSRYFRTAVEPNPETNPRPTPNVITAPAPLFGPTCCHCISCSSSWLFRDVNKASREWCCQRGHYHPTAGRKLPFGAASSVNTFMPRYANNNPNPNNNCCDDHEGDTDSLNTSELMDTHQHNRQQFSDCNTRTEQTTRRQQLRRIAQPNGTHNWIHSSEMTDDLHKKHSNINNISRDQTRDQSNLNNFRARNRQIGNENIVVWNNNNDERLI